MRTGYRHRQPHVATCSAWLACCCVLLLPAAPPGAAARSSTQAKRCMWQHGAGGDGIQSSYARGLPGLAMIPARPVDLLLNGATSNLDRVTT